MRNCGSKRFNFNNNKYEEDQVPVELTKNVAYLVLKSYCKSSMHSEFIKNPKYEAICKNGAKNGKNG